jgi:hypothetical protein
MTASRHVPLRPVAWDADVARVAIGEIIADALAHFEGERFWPAHPSDDDVEDGNGTVYIGAAGMLWALDALRRRGSAMDRDFSPVHAPLLARTKAGMEQFGPYGKLGSLLLGDLGTALVLMRLAPSPASSAIVEARCRANDHFPVRELMWGLPGSMLAAVHMAEITGNMQPWQSIFSVQAIRLLADLQDTAHGPIWVQDLYGSHEPLLGAVHGYASNMVPLLRGWQWLDAVQRQRIAEVVPSTLAANACRSAAGVNWPDVAGAQDQKPSHLCQHCHGAPGMVTTLADAPFASPEFDKLLLEGGRYTWEAGPLAKGSNLCHGTAGNGYAFLKLYARTKDHVWIDRARAFAMTAIAQVREEREKLGRGRFTLWTGDVGVAIYLDDCLAGRGAFPTVDIL